MHNCTLRLTDKLTVRAPVARFKRYKRIISTGGGSVKCLKLLRQRHANTGVTLLQAPPPPLHTHTHTHAHAHTHTHILSPQKKRKRGCNSPALALLSLSVAFKILSVFTTGSTSNQPGYGMPADTQARLAAQKEGTLESETKNKYKKKTSKKAL